jgi:predicted dehydrogenase
MTVGVGIIGCGLVGRKRAAALPTGARLVSVFDEDRARAAQLAESSVDDVDRAATVEQLLARNDIELVVIATPHRDLASLAVAALDEGKHILVEKPGGIDVGAARLVAQRAVSKQRLARVGFNHRFHPSFLEAKQIVDRNAYGGVLHIRARYGHGGRLGYEREWRADPAVSGGGELIDQGIHLVDLTRYLTGDVELVFSELRTEFWPMAVEDNAYVALRSHSGAFAWLHASWTEWKNLFSFELMLERAKVEITGLGGSYGVETLTIYEMLPEMGPPRVRTQDWPQEDRSWAEELADVVGAIDGQPGHGSDIGDAVAALSIVDAAYRRREEWRQ